MSAHAQIDALADAIAERLAKRLLELDDRRPFYTAETLAERLGLSPRTVRSMIANGSIPSLKIGTARRVEPRAVDELIERMQRQA